MRTQNKIAIGLVLGAGVLCGMEALSAGTTSNTPAAARVQQDEGMGIVYAFHSITLERLPGMPVYVAAVVTPEGTVVEPMVFETGADGSVTLTLERGSYDVWIEFNNHRSNVERLVINPDIDFTPYVNLFFNPDID